MKKNLLITALFCGTFAFSQESDLRKIKPGLPVFNTDSVIGLGIEFHDKKEYDKASEQFQLVNENDSNYVLSQVELANTYLAQNKDSIVLQICNKIAYSNPAYRQNILILQAIAYENLKKYDEVVKTYKQGMKEYPMSAKFYHELAVFYFAQKKYKEAQDNFMEALKINPYYTPTHFQLGFFALKQKKIIPAMLAWQFYLICDKSSKRAQNVISYIEKIGDDLINYDEIETFEPIDQNDDFADIESIVKSKAAYNAKFKPLVNLNYRLLKQVQVVLEKIEFNESDKGFYNQFYAKFFKELNKNGYNETYLYYLLSGMKLEDVDKWNQRNAEKVGKFGDWVTDYIMKNYSKTNQDVNGQSTPAYKLFYRNELSGIGNLDSKNKLVGYWHFYHSGTSFLKSEGSFNASYEKEGAWKSYYKSSKLKEVCGYVKDKLNGDYKEYYENGKLKQHLNYADGKLHGKQRLYYSNGALKGEYDYDNDMFTGWEYAYYDGGQLKFKVPVKNRNYDGELQHFYQNGNKKEIVIFSNGIKTGKGTEYYDFPKDAIRSEGNYEDNFPVGEWKYYYENGKISNQGSFGKKGMKDGIWKSYTYLGNISSEDSYSNGKSEGLAKNFYKDGKTYEEFFYKKNKITAYKYYDKTGKLIKEENKQKNEFTFELFNHNGSIRRTGKTIGEELDGPLTSYDMYGIKTSYTEYKNDKKHGIDQSFHSNGHVDIELKYNEDIANGPYKRYFSNGKTSIDGYYTNNDEQGYWFYYFNNGTISEIRYYRDGRKTGWQRLFTCDGKLSRAEYISDGYIRTRLYYDTLGNVLQKNNYDSSATYVIKNHLGSDCFLRPIKNNLVNGVSINYYPNGKPYSERDFSMNLENGISKTYDEFGKLHSEEAQQNDQANGVTKNYYENGTVSYLANYINGELSGEEIYYHENGKIFVKSNYYDGMIDGEQETFDETGELMIKKFFRNNYLESYSYLTETGTLCTPILITDPNSKIKTLFKNKNTAMEYSLKNGDKEGKCVLFYSNGNKMAEEFFTDGYFNGPRTTYYINGKVKSKENYYYNLSNGAFTDYFESGAVKKTGYFLNGKKHGLFTFYDAAGKVTLKCYYYNDNVLKFIK